jgi:hypothetical protein
MSFDDVCSRLVALYRWSIVGQGLRELLRGRKGSLQRLRGAILAHERVGFSVNNIIETGGPTPQNHRAGTGNALGPWLIHDSTLRLLQPDAKGSFQ